MSRPLLPAGPVLTAPLLAGLALVGGRYLQGLYLRPLPWADRGHFDELGILTGVYLVTDIAGRLRWLGQASRLDGLTGRLNGHDRDPARRATFAGVRVLHLDDLTPTEALNAIEGRCADLLDVRQSMKPRRWPPATNWLSLVA
ncbi:hypothetical protein [Streptomyces lavenduligriseus]|uniref:GIY-YIG domain-containing protein n=1 Tax=Streptomyces lavenduligriseus TaxID=67315 RepID=A0ABT0P303_9ACTN|nr:hypothetical protein [Streptomyces lavenduligriseus]MCL3998094.1 hypothetical protein [Streptomyces lavenduligriseus]